MAWRETGVNEGQELLSDVGGDGLGEWRVKPGDCPASRLGAVFGGSWLLLDKLVVVAGLVEGLLVGSHHSQKLLLVAGEPAEAPVHLHNVHNVCVLHCYFPMVPAEAEPLKI